MKILTSTLVLLAAVTGVYAADTAPKGIVSQDAEVKQLGTGMKFTEGPVWLPAKNIVVFSDIDFGVGVVALEASLFTLGLVLEQIVSHRWLIHFKLSEVILVW